MSLEDWSRRWFGGIPTCGCGCSLLCLGLVTAVVASLFLWDGEYFWWVVLAASVVAAVVYGWIVWNSYLD